MYLFELNANLFYLWFKNEKSDWDPVWQKQELDYASGPAMIFSSSKVIGPSGGGSLS